MAKNRGMNMKLKILALVVMLGIVGRVDAGFYTAGQVLSDCESEVVGLQNDCVSYLAGIIDATNLWVAYEVAEVPKLICLADGVTMRQLRKVYIRYANEHPKELHIEAAILSLKAFIAAFPCK
jgi:hypothetical protein